MTIFIQENNLLSRKQWCDSKAVNHMKYINAIDSRDIYTLYVPVTVSLSNYNQSVISCLDDARGICQM